jgi:alpha-L-fucosidase
VAFGFGFPGATPFHRTPFTHSAMRLFHSRVTIPATLACSIFCPFAVAVPPAAPVPEHARPLTPSPQSPARLAALRKWNEAKFGLFLHWGVYSVYGGTYKGDELWSAEWIQENARIPFAEYAKTASEWNPADFDADAWVGTAKDAGMRYIVITARHHDGFAIYPTKASKHHLFASGAYEGPDPLAALKAACKKHGLLFGIYYSPLEFRGSPKGFDEADAKAIADGFDYRTLGPTPYATDAEIAALAKAQIKELAEWYRPDIFWFDGTWYMMGKWTEADARESETLIRSILPNVVINNRLGLKHADFNTYENEIPHAPPGGQWEYCWNMGAFWGYNPRNYTPDLMKTPDHYIETLARIASLGGNYLLNVGPEPSGKLPPMAIDYLREIGRWVNPNRAAFEGVSSSPFGITPDWGFVTCREGKVYLIIRSGAATSPVTLPALKNRILDCRLLTKPDQKIDTKTGKHHWTVGPISGKHEGPFVIVECLVEGTPAAVGK